MQLIFYFIIPLHVVAPGSMETEYNSSNMTILNCIFPENTTKTDFAVHFHNENGKTDLLVDCAWVGDKHECIQQEHFKCRLPVTNTVEIEVPQTYVTRPSKIGYTLRGHDPSKVNFCHFVENKSEGRKESKNKKKQKNIKENNYDHRASRDFPGLVIGLVIGTALTVAVSVIVIVFRKKVCRNKQTHASELGAESPSLESTENNSRDDNSSQSTVKDHVVFFSTEKSSLPVEDEEKAPLNIQSEKNDCNIWVFIEEKNC